MLARLLATSIAVGAVSTGALAQLTLSSPYAIPAPTPGAYEGFGSEVAIDGDLLVVSSPGEDHGTGIERGQASIYSRSGASWSLLTSVQATPIASSTYFGRTVALAASRLAVVDSTNTSLWIFEPSGPTWSESARLSPTAPMAGFGASLCIRGSSVFVGAPSAATTGRVAVFTATGPFWFQAADIVLPGALANDSFGQSIAAYEGELLIAAPYTDVGSTNTGSIAVFNEMSGTWTHSYSLQSPSVIPFGSFGTAIDIDGDTLVVGQPYGELEAGNGRSFVFTRRAGVWTFQQQLVLPATTAFDGFGHHVCIDGDIAAISYRTPLTNNGHVALFARHESFWCWKMNVSGGALASVALSHDSLLIGDSQLDVGATPDVGHVLGFDLTHPSAITTMCSGDGSGAACPCGNDGGAGRGCNNSFATGGALLTASGDASICHDTVILASSGTPPIATGLYFQGTSNVAGGAGAQFGDGLRCIGGTNIRLGIKTASGGASSYPTAGDPAISVKGSVPTSGAVRLYQLWYRDVAAFCTPSGFNLTNAVRIAWTP